MGAPMLAALRTAGFDVRGLDIRPPCDFGALEPAMTQDKALFSQGLTDVFTVVRDISQTEKLLFGAHGLIYAKSLRRIILCSTLSPRYVLALRDRVPAHIALVDAPMSGAQIAATEARLSFMLGGSAADLDALQPMFNAMGRHFHRMGAYGSGMQAKVLNNLLAASNTAMTRLVLDWAAQAGLDQDRLLALIHTSSGQNWFASGFDEIEFARDGHSDDNTIGILVKDVASALDAAPDGADTSLPEQVQAQISALVPKSW